MKQYVLFSETYPDGIVITQDELAQYELDEGMLYEIGACIGTIQGILEKTKDDSK